MFSESFGVGVDNDDVLMATREFVIGGTNAILETNGFDTISPDTWYRTVDFQIPHGLAEEYFPAWANHDYYLQDHEGMVSGKTLINGVISDHLLVGEFCVAGVDLEYRPLDGVLEGLLEIVDRVPDRFDTFLDIVTSRMPAPLHMAEMERIVADHFAEVGFDQIFMTSNPISSPVSFKPKGLISRERGHVLFIDDDRDQHKSVYEHSPETRRVLVLTHPDQPPAEPSEAYSEGLIVLEGGWGEDPQATADKIFTPVAA